VTKLHTSRSEIQEALLKEHISHLMKEREIDVAIIEGPDGMDGANPAFTYLTGGEHVQGSVIIRRDQPPVLLHRTMERDNAAATGLELINYDRWPMREILEENPDPLNAKTELYRRIMSDLDLKGRIAFYGTGSIGSHYTFLKNLQTHVNGSEIYGEFNRDLFEAARETKDADEIDLMRKCGEKTCAVIGRVVKFLKLHDVRDETLIKEDDQPLTIGNIKELIRLEVARHGLHLAGDFIFAIGRDGGVPHSTGNPSDVIKLGQSIVFDLFPRDEQGYFHDVTRTFSIGYATPEVQECYNQVRDCFDKVVAELKVGENTQKYQHMTCDIFESLGHPTQRSNPSSAEGYIHSLGHGLGLEVHEEPYFPTFGKSERILQPGMVFTIEPGLYYPNKGYGVRIEDTYYCDEAGRFHSMTPAPKDLVIPMK